MRKVLLLLSLSVSIHSAMATTIITIDENSPSTFSFDVVWGPTYIPDPNQSPVTFGNFIVPSISGGEVTDANSLIYISVESDTPKYPLGVWISSVVLTLGPTLPDGSFDRHLTSGLQQSNWNILPPASASVTADGFGVHLVYDLADLDARLENIGNGSGVQSTPDGGNSATMLVSSIAVLGWVARRSSANLRTTRRVWTM